MFTTYQASHQCLEMRSTFETFTSELEALVGRFDIDVLTLAKTNPEAALRQLQAMHGEQDLILFAVYDHGALLNILGMPTKAKQYLIGNALTASTMTKHDIRAALYAPLRILVSEQRGKVVVEYDLAANSFGQFNNGAVDAVAQSLDLKMGRLLARADASSEHYGNGDLLVRVQAALNQANLSSGHLTVRQLEPLDQFHAGGHEATVTLTAGLGLTAQSKVLDVGCGLGGPARAVAEQYGCEVNGVDLAPQFVAVAKMLSERVNCRGSVKFQTANALKLPFDVGTFDHAYSQHVAMNIEDRDALYAEISRVLKPAGTFAMYDVILGSGEKVIYPTPWSSTGSTSFLLTKAATESVMQRQGFKLKSWTDCSASGTSWFKELGKRMATAPEPVFGLPVVMGPGFAAMTANFAKNLREDRVRLVQAVFQRI